MRNLIVDLRLALRHALRRPGFALAAILSLALGVGAVTVVFSLVDAVLLRPLDVPRAEGLVALHRVGGEEADISLPDAVALRRELRQLDAVSLIATDWALDLARTDAPLHVNAGLTESHWFAALGVRPLAGRLLDAADDVPGAEPVIVLRERLWRSAFAADPAVLGRVLRLSGVSARVVGVAPDAADVLDARIEAWVPVPPFAPWAPTSPGSNNFEAIGHLAAGASLASAREELRAVTAARAAANPKGSDKILDLTPLAQRLSASVRGGLWLVLGAAALVLLLAGVNVAALLLVRGSGRVREIAVRHALGAGRPRITAQLLGEGLLLGLAGGAVGVLLAVLGLDAFKALVPGDVPRLAQASIDGRALATALVATLACALGFSLAPALHLGGEALAGGLRGGRSLGSASRQRSLDAFVVFEVASAALLLALSALLLRSFAALVDAPLGFEPRQVATAELVLPEAGYGQREPQTRAITAIVDRLRATPGVRAAGFVTGMPLAGTGRISHSLVVDGVAFDDGPAPGAAFRPFDGAYFEAMGIRTLAGRAPAASARDAASRVAWVNRRFAETVLRGRDPVGMRIAWTPGEASESPEPQWMTVAGVVDDVRGTALRSDDVAAVYVPYVQRDDGWIRFGSLVARVEGDPAAYAQVLQAAVTAVDPEVALAAFDTLAARVERASGRDRFNLLLVSTFGAIALLLGLQGLFGVVAYAVEQRRAEIALRLAIGASPRAAIALALRQGLRPALAGVAIGLAGALALGRLLAGLLYGVSPHDLPALLAAAAAVSAACVLAVWWPAQRAGRVEPMTALRGD